MLFYEDKLFDESKKRNNCYFTVVILKLMKNNKGATPTLSMCVCFK